MFKKLFVTFLAVMYLGVSSGATLHFQYCMGRLVRVSLWHDEDKQCHTCGMKRQIEQSKKCCTDKHQVLKSADANTVNYSQVSFDVFPALPAMPVLELFQLPITRNNTPYAVYNDPPWDSGVALFLRNCTFRIWFFFSSILPEPSDLQVNYFLKLL